MTASVPTRIRFRNCNIVKLLAPKRFDEDILSYLLRAQPKLNEFIKASGFKKLRPLGSGDHGTAYSDGVSVLKITDDPQEANTSMYVVPRPIDGMNEIFKVCACRPVEAFYFEDAKKPVMVSYYLIVQDLLDPALSATERNVIELFGNCVLSKTQTWPLQDHRMLFAMNSYADKHGMKRVGFADRGVISELVGVMNRMHRAGLRCLDISPQNVGRNRKGKLTLMDFGLSSAPVCHIPLYDN